MSDDRKKIVVIGGGTGIFAVLNGLKKYFDNISAVVSMADDGGSTGTLREEFGILPPGDIRRAIIALACSDNKILSELFNYRFKEGRGLAGHSFGNLMIAALERITGNFDLAIKEASKIFGLKGKVMPATLQHTRLCAELENGATVNRETDIDIPKHDGRLKIKRVWLKPAVKINPEAAKEIKTADLIIIGPGDLYTSLIPNLLIKGLKESLKQTKAKTVYFVNLMTKHGETDGFKASDFLKVLESYLGKGVLDYVVVNNKKPAPARLRLYASERATLVENDLKKNNLKPILIAADLLRPRGFLRHDPGKTANIIKKLF
ncbi:MAG: gluconeogenesis factor YvcK family protein [Patescibacteria group bacterium]